MSRRFSWRSKLFVVAAVSVAYAGLGPASLVGLDNAFARDGADESEIATADRPPVSSSGTDPDVEPEKVCTRRSGHDSCHCEEAGAGEFLLCTGPRHAGTTGVARLLIRNSGSFDVIPLAEVPLYLAIGSGHSNTVVVDELSVENRTGDVVRLDIEIHDDRLRSTSSECGSPIDLENSVACRSKTTAVVDIGGESPRLLGLFENREQCADDVLDVPDDLHSDEGWTIHLDRDLRLTDDGSLVVDDTRFGFRDAPVLFPFRPADVEFVVPQDLGELPEVRPEEGLGHVRPVGP